MGIERTLVDALERFSAHSKHRSSPPVSEVCLPCEVTLGKLPGGGEYAYVPR